jgi:cytochrome c peroxidase
MSVLFLMAATAGQASAEQLTLKQQLGKRIFFDRNLSNPPGQSCASCHDPKAGFADPRRLSVSRGAICNRFGDRNAPSAAYAAYSPPLHFDPTVRPGIMAGMYVGGLFWDGRADSLEEQAEAPFLNPLEMHNANKRQVVLKVVLSRYACLFRAVFGPGAFWNTDRAYECVTEALAEYERSSEVCQFTSKYDYYLAGVIDLNDQEMRGLMLFTDTTMMGAKCANCHSVSTDNPSGRPLFTNFGYQNIGVPRNLDNPFYRMPRVFNPDGKDYVDLGLGGELDDPMEDGKFKIPSLRNCAVTAPYMHNGVFKTLKEVVHFDNTRDELAVCGPDDAMGEGCWPPPEVDRNIHRHMPPMPRTFGQLKLTDEQEDDIAAFLMTLTDGYEPQ